MDTPDLIRLHRHRHGVVFQDVHRSGSRYRVIPPYTVDTTDVAQRSLPLRMVLSGEGEIGERLT